MKTITKETIVTNYIYEAFDGTQFVDEEECKKYEKSAECVINAKLNNLNPIKVVDMYADLWLCTEDAEFYSVLPQCEKDIDDINIYLSSKPINDELVPYDCIGKRIIICDESYNHDSFWWDALDNIKDRYNKVLSRFESEVG